MMGTMIMESLQSVRVAIQYVKHVQQVVQMDVLLVLPHNLDH
jgi:hypothetical protein